MSLGKLFYSLGATTEKALSLLIGYCSLDNDLNKKAGSTITEELKPASFIWY